MEQTNKHEIALDLMSQASIKLEDFVSGFTKESFLLDKKTQSAVIMQLVVIGELAKKIPVELKQKIDLPWRLMAGFRDFAVHEYFELDLNQVWTTITQDAPVVKEKLQKFLSTP